MAYKKEIINSKYFTNVIKNLVTDLNNLFKDAEINIAFYLKKQNIMCRKRKITFKDSLAYKFKYASKNVTQKEVTHTYKMSKQIDCNDTAFYKKESKIPLEYYDDVYESLMTIFKKYVEQPEITTVAVDGTFNNTNQNRNGKLETTLNMTYFDVGNEIPILIDSKNCKKNGYNFFI